MTTRLSLETLNRISTASVPHYDRAALTPGILHFGVGNFHRSHLAVYLDRLFNRGRDHDWAIVGAGVMPSDSQMRDALAGQDYLTTVVEQSAEKSTARITGAMTHILPIGDAAAIVARLSDPAIRIVSLTVTEGGYFIDPATARFDPDDPAVRADVEAPNAPRTVFGLIAAGLSRRRAAGIPPFTVMSCDNIPHNGGVARNTVAGFARLVDPGFAAWVDENVAFPNSMVDRITPATGAREHEFLAANFGIEDAAPVFCEDFSQWVLEDDFPSGRPALETVGVQFAADVTPYEHMKIRILNGGHSAIAYPAGMMGIHFVHEAMKNPLLRQFLRKLVGDEIIPVVPPVPDTDLEDYYRLIESRFANPKIADTIQRLCFDGSNRQPKFIIPSIIDRLSVGAKVTGLALVSALWCRYCHGETERGAAIEPNDPNWGRLMSVARVAREDPMAWLAMDDIYGELGRTEPFRASFGHALRALWAHGTQETLSRYLNDAL